MGFDRMGHINNVEKLISINKTYPLTLRIKISIYALSDTDADLKSQFTPIYSNKMHISNKVSIYTYIQNKLKFKV